jgi:hypothetical protein
MSEPWEPRNAWLMRYAAYEEMHKCIPGGSQAPPDCQGLLGHTTSPPLELGHCRSPCEPAATTRRTIGEHPRSAG